MKKVTALIISAVILVMCALPCFASAEEICPVIDIRGFMSYNIYHTEADGTRTQVFPMTSDTIKGLVKNLAPSLARLGVSNNWSEFGDSLISSLNSVFMPLAALPGGVFDPSTGPDTTYPTAEKIAAEGGAEFRYDWRADPFDSAAKLNDFVNYVTDECGCGRVCLEAHSFGGIIMMTYLKEYGCEKVRSCCFNATAVFGAEFAGQLVTGNVDVNADELTEFLQGLFDHGQQEAILNILTDALLEAGITQGLTKFVNLMFSRLGDVIWTNSILPVFGNWPGMWSMVPDELVDAGEEFFRTYTDEIPDEYEALFATVNRFNTEIRPCRAEILSEINDNCNMYVIARYGYPGVPLGSGALENTDCILSAKNESFGATTTLFGTLPVSAESGAILSPDGRIDASTCLFPEQTWFIRNCKHTQREDSIKEFTKALLFCDGQATVDTFEQYPRFLVYDETTKLVTPDSGKTGSNTPALDRIIGMFHKIKLFFDKLFSGALFIK